MLKMFGTSWPLTLFSRGMTVLSEACPLTLITRVLCPVNQSTPTLAYTASSHREPMMSTTPLVALKETDGLGFSAIAVPDIKLRSSRASTASLVEARGMTGRWKRREPWRSQEAKRNMRDSCQLVRGGEAQAWE